MLVVATRAHADGKLIADIVCKQDLDRSKIIQHELFCHCFSFVQIVRPFSFSLPRPDAPIRLLASRRLPQQLLGLQVYRFDVHRVACGGVATRAHAVVG